MNDPASIVLCLPSGTQLFDPDPEITEQRDLRIVDRWADDTIGAVGWRAGGLDALRLAVEHPELPRIAIVSTPFPSGDSHGLDLDAVLAKTLLLIGQKDPETGSKHGTAWQKRLADARLEMVPGADHDILIPRWGRILSHLAPRRKR